MPDQYPSATYHLAGRERIPQDRLVYVDEHEDALSRIYLHRLHADSRLLDAFNRISGHQVGHGMWRQNWTHEGRMQLPAQGLGVAVSQWEILPAHCMPSERVLIPVEEEGLCVWLIREGYCTRALRDEMNRKLERIAGDGLWLQDWHGYQALGAPRSGASALV